MSKVQRVYRELRKYLNAEDARYAVVWAVRQDMEW